MGRRIPAVRAEGNKMSPRDVSICRMGPHRWQIGASMHNKIRNVRRALVVTAAFRRISLETDVGSAHTASAMSASLSCASSMSWMILRSL